MAKKINEAIEAAIAAGAVVLDSFVDSEGKPLRVRQMDSDYDPLNVGDVLSIPEEYKVLGIKFNPEDEDEKPHPFIFVEVLCADGSERNWRFFPNSLCKTVRPFENGHTQPKVKTTGTATDLYLTKDEVNEALALLKGRKIKVSASTVYSYKQYQTGEIKETHIYQYDLV